MTAFPRLLGAATLAYSVAVVANPKVLAGPCELVDDLGEVPRDVAVAVRAVSTRDAIVSAVMLVAPVGPALRTATLVRGLCDVSDAVVFGLPATPAGRRKIAGVAVGWGSLCLLARRWA